MSINFVAPGIALFENILPEGESLMEDLEYSVNAGILSWTSAQVANAQEAGSENKYVRDTFSIGAPMPPRDTSPPDPDNSPSRFLMEYGLGCTFRDAFQGPLDSYLGFYGVDIRTYDSYQILKYGVGQKFDKHMDDHWRYPRRVSLTYYANDAYEGGEIEFDQFNIKIKPEKGNLLLFPSTFVYSHKVYPVTSGTRYAVVQWMR
jgi:hypothetical protein